MCLFFDAKIVKVTVTDEKGKILWEAEKGFVMPKNLDSDEDSILMIKGKNMPELEYNTLVSVITTSKANDRVKYNGSVSVSMDKQLNIKLMKNNSSETLQERRRFFKIKVSERGRVLYYVRGEKTVRLDEPVPIGVNDINQGGIFMTCETEFEEGDLLSVDTELFVDAPLNAAVKILRVQRNPDGQIKGYGCEFQALTGAQSDLIGRYIYKVQSEARQRESAKNDLL